MNDCGKSDDGQVAPRFYRVRQIVEMTGMSKGKVFQALRSGRLTGLKLDGVLLIPTESLEDWLSQAVPYCRTH